MASPKSKSDRRSKAKSRTEEKAARVSSDTEPSGWGVYVKVAVSCWIVFHLFAVLVAPMAMPQPSSALFRRLDQLLTPYSAALYMRHGYRFFAPDPGPSHLIRYEVAKADGTLVTGKFPDRKIHRPRLMYHRFFMISEHFWGLGTLETSDPSELQRRAELAAGAQFLRENGHRNAADWLARASAVDEGPVTDKEIDRIVNELKIAGRHHAAATARQTLLAERESLARAKQHRDIWLAGMANFLKDRFDGVAVRIWIQEHAIPDFDHVRDGRKLDEPDTFQPPVLVYSDDEVVN